MTYYGGRELAESFRTVRKNTITIAEDIPEDKYSFRATPDTMTVAELLSHVAVSARGAYEMYGARNLTSFAEIDFPTLMKERREAESALTTKAQIVAALRESGEQFAHWLQGLSEEQLAAPIGMAGPNAGSTKSRFEVLLGVKEHEMHERAKLMVIERMLGIVPHITRQRQAFTAQLNQAQAAR